VDRNFALDYTLKSLEKVLDGLPRHAVRQARTVLKDAAYTVLGDMIAEIEAQPSGWSTAAESGLSARIGAALDARLSMLQVTLDAALRDTVQYLPSGHVGTLYREHRRWQSVAGWRLINAADLCGT
jgi:hypothetical protein